MTSVDWVAPQAPHPLRAVVTLPGSKSQTNRLLVLAALAPGRSLLRRPLRSRDTELMVAGLRTLGFAVSERNEDWQVDGQADPARPTAAVVDVGNAGTVARFLPPVAALGYGPIRFDGDPRVRERPVAPLLRALRAIGGQLDSVGGLPVLVTGTGSLTGGRVELDASASSQLISALLLVGPRCEHGVTVRHCGGRLPSGPHLAMTVAALRQAGAQVDDSEPGCWVVAPGPLRPSTTSVEPDLSTAAAYLAAPLLAGGSVTIVGWPDQTAQPGAALPELLSAMGGRVTRERNDLTVAAGNRLTGIDVDLGDAAELTPVLAALAAVADSPSRLTGIAHIRLHETDRLRALATELNAAGADVRELPDGLEVRPRPLSGRRFASYDDHRLAMAWAVLGLAVPGVRVADLATTRKTVPDFAASWHRMLAGA